MKILIIGEFSAFAYNLKIGLNEIGHKVTIVSWGDGFKKIPCFNDDYIIKSGNYSIRNFIVKGSWRLRNLINNIRLIKLCKYLRDNHYDRIMLINPAFVRESCSFFSIGFTFNQLKSIEPDTNKWYLSLCGVDLIYKEELQKYAPIHKDIINWFTSKREIKQFEKLITFIHKGIPVMYDYSQAYRLSVRTKKFSLLSTIQLPIAVSNYNCTNNIGERITIFFGKTRPSKGLYEIEESLRIIQEKYSNIEIIPHGKLPLKEYLRVMQTANIVVDQCYELSYSMNALYAMAMGKVVLSGCSTECEHEFHFSEKCPVIHITPNVADIVDKLSNLIDKPYLVANIGIRSRRFVEQFHDTKIIASKYIDLWYRY